MKKSGKKSRTSVNGLSPIEVEIMQVIWRDKKVTVRDVHEELLRNGYVPYTTIMAAMNNLSQKGILKQNKESKAYVYSAAISNTEVANQIIDGVVDRILGGSKAPILRHLLKIKDEAELEELLKLKDNL
ncbi:MAG: BlaI/MecI/CopY family transcriptional regulator [Candidatus Aquicultor sp.]